MTARRSHRRLNGAFLFSFLALTALAAVASSQVITSFPITTPASSPEGIVTGPDGNLWFCEQAANQIGRMAPDGTMVEFPIPTPGAFPETITLGPDGALWFTELNANKIGRITLQGVITEFTIPTENSGPEGIAYGPDGNIWFVEKTRNKVGRLKMDGTFTEFPIPTAGSMPEGMAIGPDGNMWFLEQNGNKVGRITTQGVITEFPITTAGAEPWNISAGPDGNLWFTEGAATQIARITPAGVITEFPVPTPGTPDYITPGPDGNMWFNEYYGNRVAKITMAGVVTEYPLPILNSKPYGITAGPDGAVWFAQDPLNTIGRITTGPAFAKSLAVDANSVTGSSSNVNGVFEAGETVEVNPGWTNTMTGDRMLAGTASNLDGPAGPTYTIDDSSADYGTVPAESTADCHGATGDCYLMTISGTRPQPHWDATFSEAEAPDALDKTWTVHIGESFPDVPTTHQFYSFVETLFHSGVTGGCANPGHYCPADPVTRAQMAVFLMKGRFGIGQQYPPATGTVFVDVPAANPFSPFIEALAGFKVTGGCAIANSYCPNDAVLRQQMAVFLLKSKHGASYTPPACTPNFFDDVACPSPFAAWIQQLSVEGITGGCGGSNYCPTNPITRGQMAVFLTKTFGLKLYGP